MSINLCIECREREITNKKRKLCNRCYQRVRNKIGAFYGTFKDEPDSCITRQKYNSYRELEFVKNFFKHNNWIYQPALFRFNGEKYSPDFYDIERNVFIELAGTRQAYHQMKEKYAKFQKYYPQIKFEIRQPDGTLLDEKNKGWNNFQ